MSKNNEQSEPMVIEFNSKLYKVTEKKGRGMLRVTIPTTDGRKELLAPTLKLLGDKVDEYRSCDVGSVGWYYEKIWVETRIHVQKETANKDVWAFGNYILPKFGSTPLAALDRRTLQRAFNEWSEKMEPSTLRIVRGKFANLLNLAVADQEIPRNPIHGVRLPPLPAKEAIPLTSEQVFDAINHPSLGYRTLARLLALGLGAREACGVKRNEVVKCDGYYIVQVRRHRKNDEIGPTKNIHRIRDIPVPEWYGEAILADSGDIWAATTEHGLPPSHNQPNRTAKAVNKDAGSHDFRRVFETVLESEIEAPGSVMDALAGRKPKLVAGVYRRPTNETKLRWIIRYLDRLSTSCPQLFADKEEKSG